MIPLSESAFWGPMAYTIMGGLSVATFLTLLFLPAIYALAFRKSLGRESPAAALTRDIGFGPALPSPAE
jgi:multidrug efflux pump